MLQTRAKTANKETWGSGGYACLGLALTGALTGSGAAAQAEWEWCPGGRGGDLWISFSAVQLVQAFSAGPGLESLESVSYGAVAIGRSARRAYWERADAREPGRKVGFQLVTEENANERSPMCREIRYVCPAICWRGIGVPISSPFVGSLAGRTGEGVDWGISWATWHERLCRNF